MLPYQLSREYSGVVLRASRVDPKVIERLSGRRGSRLLAGLRLELVVECET